MKNAVRGKGLGWIHSLSRVRRWYSPAKLHLPVFQAIVGVDHVISQPLDLKKYTTDWLDNYQGGSLVCLPGSSEEVEKILSYCHKHEIAVVCQGGNTGLVGGGVGLEGGHTPTPPDTLTTTPTKSSTSSSSPPFDELILSLARLNKILTIDPVGGIITCEAGCILAHLNDVVKDLGYQIPLDLGAKGSCMIGGNIATNAGGLHVLQFGSLHNTLLGLEVILANGEKLDMLRALQKDNLGYHLPHLFLGSEGTLGVITKVCLRLAVLPKATKVLFARVRGFQAVARLLQFSRHELSSRLIAFEFMDGACLQCVKDLYPHLMTSVNESVIPISSPASSNSSSSSGGGSGSGINMGESKGGFANQDFCVLLEMIANPPSDASNNSEGQDDNVEESYLNEIGKADWFVDAVLADSSRQQSSLWSIREHIPVALFQQAHRTTATTTSTAIVQNDDSSSSSGKKKWISYLHKFDLSVALEEVPAFLDDLALALKKKGYHTLSSKEKKEEEDNTTNSTEIRLSFFTFGHAGDQNIHLNLHSHHLVSDNELQYNPTVSINEDKRKQKVQHDLEEALYPLIVARRGSLSAEHGVGQQKVGALLASRSKVEFQLFQKIKAVFDEKNILNPGKVLPLQ